MIHITWVLGELDRNGYVLIEGALDDSRLARLSSAVDAVWRSECPNGGELHRLAFIGLDATFVELVDHPLTLPLVTAALGWNIYLYHCHLDVHPPGPVVIPPVWAGIRTAADRMSNCLRRGRACR